MQAVAKSARAGVRGPEIGPGDKPALADSARIDEGEGLVLLKPGVLVELGDAEIRPTLSLVRSTRGAP
jgi:hypothetical protein